MLVESFECEEIVDETIEQSDEAMELIQSLGLEGQKDLVAKKDGSDRESRCPYRLITAEEQFAYRVMCPREFKLSEYRETPIPLRVLQIASHAQSLGMFKRLCVWDRESVTVKDPVLVGYTTGEYEWASKNQTFILARWGEQLDAFALILKNAIAKKREQLRAEAERAVSATQCMTDAQVLSVGWNGGVSVPF